LPLQRRSFFSLTLLKYSLYHASVLISNTTRNAFNFVWRGWSVEKERERAEIFLM
jgi:hypothetical protein